ncbi:MAG: hypothetical protein GY772_21540, partial [bacterium]|nr:hypothetical protein [bacterium]
MAANDGWLATLAAAARVAGFSALSHRLYLKRVLPGAGGRGSTQTLASLAKWAALNLQEKQVTDALARSVAEPGAAARLAAMRDVPPHLRQMGMAEGLAAAQEVAAEEGRHPSQSGAAARVARRSRVVARDRLELRRVIAGEMVAVTQLAGLVFKVGQDGGRTVAEVVSDLRSMYKDMLESEGALAPGECAP